MATDIKIAGQEKLVSGINIKTINGNSVLGSGDLVVGGGSGGQLGPHNINGYIPTFAGTDVSTNGIGVGASVYSVANALWSMPFIPNKTVIAQSFRISVGTPIAGALARFLIYSNNNGLPDSKLYESTDIDCSTFGTKFITTPFTFNAGTTYFLSLHLNSSGVLLTGLNASSVLNLFVQSSGVTSAGVTMFSTIVAFGSAPSTYTYSTFATGVVPRIGIYI